MLPKVLRLVPAAAFTIAMLLLPQLALAHAVLVDSTPKLNETIHGSTLKIDLKFNSRVDGARSTVQLVAADGTVKTLELDTQTSPNEIYSHVQNLTKGSYALHWQAVANDGHITRGQIPFQVE